MREAALSCDYVLRKHQHLVDNDLFAFLHKYTSYLLQPGYPVYRVSKPFLSCPQKQNATGNQIRYLACPFIVIQLIVEGLRTLRGSLGCAI